MSPLRVFYYFLRYIIGKNLKIHQKNEKRGQNRKVFELCYRAESENMSKNGKKGKFRKLFELCYREESENISKKWKKR